jgi:putative FmdB family regulatory protein
MPTYSYQCKKCDHVLDVFHAMSAQPRIRCTECGGTTKRLMGTGAGIIFRGSGFYETDYKNKGSNGKAKTESQSESKTEGKSESKTETKSESSNKSESNSGGDSSKKGSGSGQAA